VTLPASALQFMFSASSIVIIFLKLEMPNH